MADAIVQRFGESILNSARQIDRSALAKIVFGTSDEHRSNRKILESILHPLVRRQLQEQVDAAKSEPNSPLIVLDIPLLYEVGWDDACDAVLFVDAPDGVRWERAAKRGWTQENWLQRERSQMSLDEKRQRADWVLRNDGDLDQLETQVKEFISAANLVIRK